MTLVKTVKSARFPGDSGRLPNYRRLGELLEAHQCPENPEHGHCVGTQCRLFVRELEAALREIEALYVEQDNTPSGEMWSIARKALGGEG